MKLTVLALSLLFAVSSFGQFATCVTPPPGLVGWWRAEGDATDSVGANSGTLANGAGFATGEVGQAFSITDLNQCVQIPDRAALNPTNGFSLEAWVFMSDYPASDGVVVVGKSFLNATFQYDLDLTPAGSARAEWHFQPTIGVQGGTVRFQGATLVKNNTWYHVVMTYNNTQLLLYVNGNLDGSLFVGQPVQIMTAPLFIGGYGQGPWTFLGRVDEVSLYNRALDSSEVQALYSAGSAGKCFPPQIILQPQGQVGYWGRNVTFIAEAKGSLPLSYLWYKDGAAIPWATSDKLVLTNLALADGGNYSVVVSNLEGSATSSNAFLTVNPAGVTLGLYAGLTIQGATSNTYGIQYATNVSPTAVWNTLTQITLIQPVQLWVDTNVDVAAGNSPRRFYRVVAIP